MAVWCRSFKGVCLKACLQAHLKDLPLAEGLESHVLAFVFDQHDLPKGTRAQDPNPLQV